MPRTNHTTFVITYCSRDKDPAPDPLPAVDRYLSSRIRTTCEAAAILKTEARILSGLYGLLEPLREIPPYDHLLTGDQVTGHAALLAKQLKEAGTTMVIFVTRPLSVDPDTAPYRKAMEQACAAVGAVFEILELGSPEPSPAEMADLIRPLLGCPYS